MNLHIAPVIIVASPPPSNYYHFIETGHGPFSHLFESVTKEVLEIVSYQNL